MMIVGNGVGYSVGGGMGVIVGVGDGGAVTVAVGAEGAVCVASGDNDAAPGLEQALSASTIAISVGSSRCCFRVPAFRFTFRIAGVYTIPPPRQAQELSQAGGWLTRPDSLL